MYMTQRRRKKENIDSSAEAFNWLRSGSRSKGNILDPVLYLVAYTVWNDCGQETIENELRRSSPL
jgi:hypothetical protein